MRVEDVARALSAFPSPSQTPLAEILRARLAFFQAKEVDAVLAYENAIELGPGRDGLWLETASALETLGFDERAETYLRRLSRMGSRDANVYYSLAMLAASDNKEAAAEDALYRAWNLRPAERRTLFSAAALWSTLRKPRITSVIRLNSAAEATFASESVSRRAIALPADAQPSVSGDYLHIRIAQQELAVPGGAALAPAGTTVVDAGVWSRLEDEKALEDFAQLVAVARNAGAYTQPLLRRRIERCAAALALHNRWKDLIQLTDGVSAKSEHVPTGVLFLRNVALQRTQRLDDARVLLTDLARSPVLIRRNDPQTFVELGEMLASADLFDAAIKVLDRAAAARSSASVEERVSKIQMNRQLATKYQTYNSGHFEIHYPDDVSPAFATQIGNVLESELKRLQKWVAVPNFRTTVVNVVWWRDFRSTLTGSDFILGLYQGKITVPLAGIPDFYPPIVAILTHELMHAMLAQATNDAAPHWFQEGLAQRVEMVEIHRNAFNMYDDERLLSVSLLDAVLRGSPDPEMIGEAYIVSQTIIRYVEAVYGRQGIAKLIAAFRDGATTEEAIQRLSGESVAEFDTRLRAWGRAGLKIFENQELVSYMQREEGDLRWSRR
jgi:tetratricopeptide (TPR) repeat protein